MNIKNLRILLLDWFQIHRRELPWRISLPDGNRDPYRVIVSEIMLQQTQVKVVLPYFQNWMEKFPTFEALAQATEDEVLSQWTGLGYYRRARSLHALAKAVMAQHQGQFPMTRDEILDLPGIGPYTCGAVMSLAFGKPAPILDGNLIRVFCRMFAWDGDPMREPLKAKLWQTAQDWAETLPRQSNEALMELGALCCSPKNPNCMFCPLQEDCRAFEQGNPLSYPQKKKEEKESWRGEMWWIEQQGKILLVRNGKAEFGQNYWIPPLWSNQQLPTLDLLKERSKSRTVKHSITKYKIEVNNRYLHAPHEWRVPREWGEILWLPWAELTEILHFNLARKGLPNSEQF